MSSLLLLVALSCPIPEIVTLDGKWTFYDEQAKDGAAIRCGLIYPKSPCLVKFVRVADKKHRAVCGAKR